MSTRSSSPLRPRGRLLGLVPFSLGLGVLLLAASMVGGSQATDLMGIRLDQALAEGRVEAIQDGPGPPGKPRYREALIAYQDHSGGDRILYQSFRDREAHSFERGSLHRVAYASSAPDRATLAEGLEGRLLRTFLLATGVGLTALLLLAWSLMNLGAWYRRRFPDPETWDTGHFE